MTKLYDIVLHDSVNILFTIVFILVLIGLCFLLFISILKSAKKSKVKNIDNINDGLVSKERLNDAINTFIKRFRFDNEMTLIMYEYNDLKSIRDTFGDRQYERISRILLNRVLKMYKIIKKSYNKSMNYLIVYIHLYLEVYNGKRTRN